MFPETSTKANKKIEPSICENIDSAEVQKLLQARKLQTPVPH